MPLGLGFLREVMLRFDRRVARSFEVSEGGGEYKVARGLKEMFWHEYNNSYGNC
jgi:hypothetical protein